MAKWSRNFDKVNDFLPNWASQGLPAPGCFCSEGVFNELSKMWWSGEEGEGLFWLW